MNKAFMRLVGDSIRGVVVLLAFCAIAVVSFGTAKAGSHGPASGPVTQAAPADEFERRVRAYILKNPDVILEALQLIERREQAAQGDEIKRLIIARRNEIFDDPASPVGGNPQGDITVVEFFDYNCPYCRRVAPMLAEAEKADPGLRFVYKEWPILGPNSTFAALAALAAVKQGKYVAFHKAMMGASGVVNEGKVIEIAKAAALDVARLKKDMDDPEIKAMIERNHALAAALRITGTPSFVIGDQVVRGAVDSDTFRSLVKEARERK
jgi:protein-disulfide isomerase